MPSLNRFMRLAEELLSFEEEYGKTPKENHTMFSIEIQRDEFKSLWESVKRAYEDFLTSIPTEESLVLEAKSKYLSCRQAYILCAAEMGQLSFSFIPSAELSSTRATSSHEFNAHTHHMNIPPCDTELFYGDYLSWPSFRDLFSAIYINNRRLKPVEKLFHLIQKTRGEANEIVRKSPLTNEGFISAWNNLKDRYENKRILVNGQLKILFNLSNVTVESGSALKQLQREINNCIIALRLYGIDVDAWDAIFTFLCSTKLPNTTLSLWEQNLQNKTEIPRWTDLDSFLNHRFQTLETVLDIKGSSSLGSSSSKMIADRSSGQGGRRINAYQTTLSKSGCCLCNSNEHLLRTCQKFIDMSYKDRFSVVKRNRLCFNCFSFSHQVKECNSNNNCLTCRERHHSLLHRGRNETSTINANATVDDVIPSTSTQYEELKDDQPNITNVEACFTTTSKSILLGTAMVNIVHEGVTYQARALIDSASQASFISHALQRRLHLSVRNVNAQVSGLNETISGKVNEICDFVLSSPLQPSLEVNVSGLILQRLTGKLPSHSLDPQLFESITDLTLADPQFFKSDQVDILIGGDVYPYIILGGIKRISESLVAQHTIFGWILTGAVNNPNISGLSTLVSFFNEVSLEKQIVKFWELEEVPKNRIRSDEDIYCEEYFKNSTQKDSDGRYIVCLPFKQNLLGNSRLGDSRNGALSQYIRNERSLMRNPSLKSEYERVINEYSDLGHMERVEDNRVHNNPDQYFLPHHAVLKPDSTSTKLRVVFNASFRTTNGRSLNDTLYAGPVLQNDLMMLILRWRLFQYVFTGDIEKMYRQIWVNRKHTCYQRILFRDTESSVIDNYELKTVTFGINCAPFLAIRTLLQLAEDIQEKYPLASEILRTMMYVDDALVGAHDIDTAIQARKELTLALDSAGFVMKKWTANTREVLKDLPMEHLLNKDFLDIDDLGMAKTLGIRWNASSDIFYFSVRPIEISGTFTKRKVLSIIAKLFDPAGWLAPIVVIAKILMQDLWLEKTEWDGELSERSLLKWEKFLKDYCNIKNVQIPRWVKFCPGDAFELHAFADASEKAYGICIYVRVGKSDGEVRVNLLCAKSRVAPVKKDIPA